MMMGSRNLRRALLGATAMAVLVGSANADIDIFFGIDTTGQPLYNRTQTGTPPTTLSAGGAEDRFVSFDFAVDATGSVSIANNAGTNTDPFLTLYSSSFDPANPLTNAVAADDDGGPVFSSLITSTLTAGATNVAVGTGFAGGNFGTSTLQFKSASANTLVLLSNLPALNTPTTITTGALQLGNGGTTGALGTGNVTNNGQLVFNRSDDFSWANNVSGTGAIVKNNNNTISLTGGTVANNLTINNGVIARNGLLTGNVAINSGGTLIGNTSITGSLTNLGTLSPGNSPGTTTVAGNYIGGGFITQEVQFNNATLPVNGTTHDFLNIGGNATGVTTLNVVGIAPSGSPVATTGNGIEVVRVGGTSAATAFRTSDRVLQGGFEYILTNVPDSSGTADGFFLQSAPREELSLNAVILSASRNHIRNTYLNAGGDVHEADWGTKLRAWISSMYQSTRAGADAGVRHKLTDWAVSAGVDYEVAPSFRVGLKGSYGNTDGDVWVRQGAMTVDGDTWSILGSAHYAMDGFYADLSAGYAATDWDVRRALNPGGLLGTFGVASNVDVDGMVGHLDAGYRFKTDSIFTLTVAGQVFYNDMDCGTNCLFAPGSVPQSVEDTSDWVGRLEAKLEAGYDEGKFRPWIAVNYTDALDGDGQTVRAGNAEVVSNTANALFGIDVGLQAELAEKLDLTVQAGVQQGLVDDVETYQVQVGLKYRW